MMCTPAVRRLFRRRCGSRSRWRLDTLCSTKPGHRQQSDNIDNSTRRTPRPTRSKTSMNTSQPQVPQAENASLHSTFKPTGTTMVRTKSPMASEATASRLPTRKSSSQTQTRSARVFGNESQLTSSWTGSISRAMPANCGVSESLSVPPLPNFNSAFDTVQREHSAVHRCRPCHRVAFQKHVDALRQSQLM